MSNKPQLLKPSAEQILTGNRSALETRAKIEANALIIDGISALQGYGYAKRYAEFFGAICDTLRPYVLAEIPAEGATAYGVEMKATGGGGKYTRPDSYQHDPVWQALKADLDRAAALLTAREKLMQDSDTHRMRHGEPLADEQGEVIPAAIQQTAQAILRATIK
jgi:hypothetical protein